MSDMKLTLLAAVTVFALSSFVACDPNTGANKQVKSGSVVSDGINVTSQGTLGSYPLNVAVTNIGAGAGSAANTYGMGNNVAAMYGMPVASPQHFDLLITSSQNMNGYMGMNAQPTSITVTPTIYNTTATQWYGQTSTWSSPAWSSAGPMYSYDAKCSSQACEILYLNIVIYINNDAKQIGIKKSMTLNKVLAVTEFVGNIQNIHTTDQIITELSTNSSL